MLVTKFHFIGGKELELPLSEEEHAAVLDAVDNNLGWVVYKNKYTINLATVTFMLRDDANARFPS